MSKSTLADLQNILLNRSVKTGSFVLASGKTSTYYVDARLTTMSPEGMIAIGSLGIESVRAKGWNPDAAGGLTLGADPVAFAICRETANSDHPLRAFTVRKEAKAHGTGNLIEGPFRSGDNVLVVEDVITTGKSALQAIDAIKNAGGKIVGVLAVVDREDGGREAIESRGYEVTALVRISDLLNR
jgi:orotate phosphoribosyltransferase